MGRHHTNPPNPGTHPQTVSAPPQGRARDPQPRTTNRGQQGGGTGNQTPPTPAGPTNTGQDTATRGGTKEPQPLYEPRPTHPPPNPPHGGPGRHTAARSTRTTAGQQKGGDGRHNLVVVTAPGKRPATFRTWKLSPAAPMVLHPRGCGRVGNRHNTPPRGGPAHQCEAPPHTPTRATTREHARNHTHTRAPPARTQHRPRQHASAKPAHSTRTRDDARNTAHPPATQPHKTSFPAHGG